MEGRRSTLVGKYGSCLYYEGSVGIRFRFEEDGTPIPQVVESRPGTPKVFQEIRSLQDPSLGGGENPENTGSDRRGGRIRQLSSLRARPHLPLVLVADCCKVIIEQWDGKCGIGIWNARAATDRAIEIAGKEGREQTKWDFTGFCSLGEDSRFS